MLAIVIYIVNIYSNISSSLYTIDKSRYPTIIISSRLPLPHPPHIMLPYSPYPILSSLTFTPTHPHSYTSATPSSRRLTPLPFPLQSPPPPQLYICYHKFPYPYNHTPTPQLYICYPTFPSPYNNPHPPHSYTYSTTPSPPFTTRPTHPTVIHLLPQVPVAPLRDPVLLHRRVSRLLRDSFVPIVFLLLADWSTRVA